MVKYDEWKLNNPWDENPEPEEEEIEYEPEEQKENE